MKIFDKMLELIVLVLSILLVAIMFISVINRYILHQSIPWSIEIIKLLHIWLVFIAGAIALKERKHVAVEFLLEKVSSSTAKRFLMTLSNGLVFLFLIVLSIKGIQRVVYIYNSGQVTVYTRLSYSIWYFAIPIGFLLMIVQLFRVFRSRMKED